MRTKKKAPISYIVQSGNFEAPSQAGFKPGTLRITAGLLIHYTKFPYRNFFFKNQGIFQGYF